MSIPKKLEFLSRVTRDLTSAVNNLTDAELQEHLDSSKQIVQTPNISSVLSHSTRLYRNILTSEYNNRQLSKNGSRLFIVDEVKEF